MDARRSGGVEFALWKCAARIRDWRAPHHQKGQAMGQIISFPWAARRRAPHAPEGASPQAGPAGGGAEILFFLGVRYCRDEPGGKGDAPKTPSTPRSRRRKRA
jgi:hypothetical protein